MPRANRGASTADDLQVVDNVLSATGADRLTRTSLLKRAAVGAAAASTFGAGGTALAAGVRSSQDGDDETPESILTAAATTEALGVTFLTEAVRRVQRDRGVVTQPLLEVLAAANRADFLHYRTLVAAGATPSATRFWLPDGLFGPRMANTFRALESAKVIFANAYLLGITVFARANQPQLARYAGEILGVEAEHRAMARQARDVLENRQSRPGFVPNNRGFQTFRLRTTAAHVEALRGLGIGFNQQGRAPGRFYEFPGDPLRSRTGFSLIAPFAA